MATVKQYAVNAWGVQQAVALKFGLDLNASGPEVRYLAMTNAVMIAGICRVLEANGGVTPAQLQAVFNSIIAADFPAQPGMQSRDPNTDTSSNPDFGS